MPIDRTWFHPAGDDYLNHAVSSDEAFARAIEIERRAGRQAIKFRSVLADAPRSRR